MSAIDAYNPSQVNGLGSGTSHTSKVITVRPSERADACLSYTFHQVGIGEAIVDAEGTCGNLMAAVGAYAIDEGYVECPTENGIVDVTVYNENIGRLIELTVPVESGRALVEGDYLMPGLVHSGARIGVSILSPGGGKTGKTFPIGRKCNLTVDGQQVEATFSDVVNPFVFVHAEAFGYTGFESNAVLGADTELLGLLETIRIAGAVASGMADSPEMAREVPSIPKVALVSAPCDYVATSGETIRADEVDIIARMISMGKFHWTFAGSGLYNLASMTLLEETVPHDCVRKYGVENDKRTRKMVRIGHPDGVAEVMVELTPDGSDVVAVGLDRTARRIMDGQCYVPDWM